MPSDAAADDCDRPADTTSHLDAFTVTQLLDGDPRPTLVVALSALAREADNDPSTARARICYANPRLIDLASLHRRLAALFCEHGPAQYHPDSIEFVSWATRRDADSLLVHSSANRQFAGYLWTRTHLGSDFCVLSADSHADDDATTTTADRPDNHAWAQQVRRIEKPASLRRPSPPPRPDVDHGTHTTPAREMKSSDELSTPVLWLPRGNRQFNWTESPLTDASPHHIKRLRLMDWSATPLGAMESWHWDLRAASDMLMRTPYPAAMYWGPQFVAIYNEAYVDLAGRKHPQLLGTPYAQGWPEIWHLIEPVMSAAWSSGQSTMKHNDRLFMLRQGFLEETFFTWSLVPLLGSTGRVAGIFNAAFETTQQVVNERRLQTLQNIGEHVSTAKALSDFWPLTLHGMADNEADFPFCLIYSTAEDPHSDESSLQSDGSRTSSVLSLEGSIGIPSDHPSAPKHLDAKGSDGFAPYMRQSAAVNGKPIMLSSATGTLPAHLIQGLQWQGFGDPIRAAVVFAVSPIAPDPCPSEIPQLRGFVVLGVNPRRPYDAAYELFISLLTRQLGTSLASILLFEDQVRRSERQARLAALDRHKLSLELHQRTQEAVESEYKFSRMAEYAPVGIFIADGRGHLTFCNGMWWQLSRQSRINGVEDRWMDNIVQEDRPVVHSAWDTLLAQKTTISLEFRFRSSIAYNSADIWVLMSAFPEKDNHGNIRTIFGCITDISAQKEAENLQSKRRKEALELKRQQENFIDITSHEMRNPLSAILQSADQIIHDVADLSEHDDIDKVRELLRDNVEAAKIINLCASHQKRIVDDILTLSKVDSKLMTINPVTVNPVQVIERILTMFEPESTAHDINLTMTIDQSYSRHGIDTVSLDPARLQQILINLITNSIKFTKGCPQRTISVALSAGSDGQSLLPPGCSFIPSQVDDATSAEAGYSAQLPGDEMVCLLFTVQDSGVGLDEADLNVLFQRFRQTSPRTHVQYEGSGLGLFISRLLVEMMGGEIGVSSIMSSGSRFFFYVKCQRPPLQNTMRSMSPKTERVDETIPSRHNTSSAALDSLHNGAAYKILIVEDNLINQRVLKRQLLRDGHEVDTANHGQEALDTLAESDAWHGNKNGGGAPSVILMDVEMPVMDGLACSRRVRELEAAGIITRHLPIIAVTAYARPEQIDDAKAAGVDDVIPKPFRIAELMPRIAELVSKFERDA